jgi:RNA polymerase sigma factor (sigma-70 family)
MMDDAQILIGLKSGDRKAWDLLYDLLYTKVYFVTQAIVDETMEAEDIAISALAKFWVKGPENFETFLQVKTFIFRTARNAAFDYKRKAKVQRSRSQDFTYVVNTTEDIATKKAEEALFKVEMLQILAYEIEKLPGQCREIFKLVIIENMPRQQVAEQLNISISTVHNQVANAKNKLKQVFTEKELIILLLLINLCSN